MVKYVIIVLTPMVKYVASTTTNGTVIKYVYGKGLIGEEVGSV